MSGEGSERAAVRVAENLPIPATESEIALRERELEIEKTQTEHDFALAKEALRAREESDRRLHEWAVKSDKNRLWLILAVLFMALIFLGLIFIFAPLDLSREVLKTVALLVGGGAGGGAGGFYLGWRAGRREAKSSGDFS